MMEKDDTLVQLFNDFAPDFQDNDSFTNRLQRKLDAVEFIKQKQEQQLRIYRIGMLCTFFLGMLSCGILLTVIFTTPADQTLFMISVPSIAFLKENLRLLSIIGTSLLMSCCIITLVSQWNELAILKHELSGPGKEEKCTL